MSLDAFLDIFGARSPHDPPDPMRAAQGSQRRPLPRRFYTHASLTHDPGAGVARLVLDGKPALTPGRTPLALPNAAVMNAVVDEWQRQESVIDPASMPLTRLVNSAIDGVGRHMAAVKADIAAYGLSDLICYRADSPATLVEAQSRHWDPLLVWARDHHGAALAITHGLVHVPQSPEAMARLHAQVEAVTTPIALAALSTLTTMSGSLVIALAVAQGAVSVDAGWQAAHVDDTWQADTWGHDDEADQRLAGRRQDFEAAARCLALLSDRG